jgi:ribosomal protein S18 acetylase RimI-like enzyme
MSLRKLDLPEDFRGLEGLVRSLHRDPNWGMNPLDIDDLLGFLSFLRHLWAPLGVVRWAMRGLQETLLGYVWVIESEIVGAVLYDRKLGTDHWQLTLLAVKPSFRQRGLAARLLDAMMQDIDARGGTTIRLEVDGNSTSARELFTRMGFETYNGFYEYDYARMTPPPPATLPEDYSVFPLSYYASQPRYDLARQTTTARQAQFEPVRHRDFQRNRLWWGLRAVSLAVQGVREHEIAVYHMLDGSIVARGGMVIRSRWGDISEVAIRVDHQHGAVVPYLFHRLVTEAQRASRRRRIEMVCPISQPAVIDYAENNGFERRSAFYKMGMVLRPDAATQERDFPALPEGE